MRDRILVSAARVFSQKGYHKASMQDISSEAGVAKGSLYYHFENKSQLFREVAISGINGLHNEVQAVMELQIPLEEKMAAIIDMISTLCYDYTELFSILMNEMSNGIDAKVLADIQLAKADLLNYISTLLREGCEYEHIIRQVDFSLLTHSIISFIYTYQQQALLRGLKDKASLLKEIRDVVMYGVLRNR